MIGKRKKKPNFFCIVLSIEKSTLVKSVRQRTEVYRSISSELREKKSLSNIETIYVEFRIQFHIPWFSETVGTWSYGSDFYGRWPSPARSQSSAKTERRLAYGDMLPHLARILHLALETDWRHLSHHLPSSLCRLQSGLLEHLPERKWCVLNWVFIFLSTPKWNYITKSQLERNN